MGTPQKQQENVKILIVISADGAVVSLVWDQSTCPEVSSSGADVAPGS